MDQQLLTGFVLGLSVLFAACLFLLVAAFGLRDLIRRLSKAGDAKQSGDLTNWKNKSIASGGMLPGNQRKAGSGIPTHDEKLSRRDQGRIQRSDR